MHLYDDVLGKTGYFAQLMSGKTEYYCDRCILYE